jgi:hypothetical protein
VRDGRAVVRSDRAVVRSDFDFDQAVRKSHAGSRGVDRNEKFRSIIGSSQKLNNFRRLYSVLTEINLTSNA